MVSQTFFDTYKELDFTTAYEVQKMQVDSLLNLSKGIDDKSSIALIASEFAIRKGYGARLKEAKYYTTIAIEAVNDNSDSNNDLLAISYYRRGFFNERIGNTKDALLDYEKTISLNYVPNRSAQSYCRIGNIYKGKGDFFKAISYYRKGTTLYQELSDYKSLVREYQNLAIVYDQIGSKSSLIKKIELLDKVEALKERVVFTKKSQTILNRNFALTYVEPLMFDFDKAKKYYFKNLSLLSEDTEEDFKGLCETYLNLADLYNIAKKDSVPYYANKSLQFCSDSLYSAYAYNHLATHYSNIKSYNNALDNLQKTLNFVGFPAVDIAEEPSFSFLENANYPLYLVEVFKQKALILYKKGQEQESSYYLELALKSIKASDILLSLIQNDEKEIRSHYYWQEIAAPIYANGVVIAKALNDNDKVFYFFEKNKASLLTASIFENTIKLKLPDIFFIEEKIKLNKIVKLQFEIDTAQEVDKSSLQDSLFYAKINLKILRDSLRIKHPELDTNRIMPEVLSLNEAKQSLAVNEVVVSYLWGEVEPSKSVLYASILTRDDLRTVEIDSIDIIKKAINEYKDIVSIPFETKSKQLAYKKLANDLYEKLLPFELLENDQRLTNLIIIPDGDLQNLPFEALQNGNTEKPYLIQSKIISYAYSLSFLMYNQAIKRKNRNSFIGFAPVNYENENLPNLPNTLEEVTAIEKIINGSIFISEKATKESFLSSIENTNIIHLATHAKATQEPWVAFSDDKLYLNEIYNTKNKAELVVLSACNTAKGEVVKGEGILSLSRGFFYAGANSVLSNAWEANDKSASEIMQSFYKHLDNGETKAGALQKAKLDYIDSHSLSELSPHYWASFMLAGDYSVIETKWSLFPFIISGFIILLLMLIYFYFKKNKKLG